jgi:hypothetical protein
MPQVTRCPHCSRAIQVADGSQGKSVRCPLCQKVFAVAGGTARQPAAAGITRRPAPAVVSAASTADVGARSTTAADVSITTAAEGETSKCPACSADIPAGAIACMDCGYLLQTDLGAEPEGQPNLCTNPACGVANSAKDRVCQRCGSPLPTAPGTLLHGRYRIERQLAVGGFGAVYLAADTKHPNRQVAVKDMICADPQEFNIRLNFFRREAEILRLLEKNPIVPRVYDFVQHGHSAHLVLEYIRGQDLLKIMEARNSQPFPVASVIGWAQSICDVLTQMHGQSPPLIHRDLKPDNIMLLEDQATIKMIDFGTARDLGRTQKTRLAAKTRVYTEGYAPPEQIVGKPEPRSDLFALAGTLYHLATGKAPEGFHTAHELAGDLNDPAGPLPREHRWFFELVKINLSEDPNERYFSAREIKADLERQQVTTEVTCPQCQATNKVREPYCARCAAPLTDLTPPCTHCGKTNRLGSRCCIHCGNRLR